MQGGPLIAVVIYGVISSEINFWEKHLPGQRPVQQSPGELGDCRTLPPEIGSPNPKQTVLTSGGRHDVAMRPMQGRRHDVELGVPRRQHQFRETVLVNRGLGWRYLLGAINVGGGSLMLIWGWFVDVCPNLWHRRVGKMSKSFWRMRIF